MSKLLLVFASLSGFLAVLLGAFGAHRLRQQLDAALFDAYQTGVQYQFIHSLAILLVALLVLQLQPNRWFDSAGLLFIVGIMLFSGSLYCLALTDLRNIGPLNIGLLTPLGGTAFMLGWLSLLAGALTFKSLPG